jgi:hypothetical protein
MMCGAHADVMNFNNMKFKMKMAQAQVKSTLPSKSPRTPRLTAAPNNNSNKINHPPFSIRIIDPDYPDDTNFQFDKNFMTLYGASGDGAAQWNTLTVPRAVREQFKVASYHRSVTKKFMPILVQTKVVRCSSSTSTNSSNSTANSSRKHLKKNKKRGNKKGNFRNEDGNNNDNENMDLCKVVVQIRSNLNNIGTLKDINIALAIPPTVIGKTLTITNTEGEEKESRDADGNEIGNGRYDELKRVVRWTIPELSRGSTVAFGVEVMVAKAPNIYVGKDDLPRFPILLRCSSIQDTVSSIQVDCRELKNNAAVDGVGAIVGSGSGSTMAADANSSIIIDVVTQRSFKLLHRLPP